MKNMNRFKLIQLLVYVFLTAVSFVLVVLDPGTRNYVAKNTHLMIICALLWLLLVLSFVFLFIDFQLFSQFRRNVKRLNQAAHADSITGIPNRFSCDSLIEKYIGAPLPSQIGCVMIDITNINDINDDFGRNEGDAAIRQFSETLHLVSAGQCFIGRNGGNKFIALFENCTEEQLIRFTRRLDEQMRNVNGQTNTPPILYKYGVAYHAKNEAENESEMSMQITDLISQANARIYGTGDYAAKGETDHGRS